MKKVGGISKTT